MKQHFTRFLILVLLHFSHIVKSQVGIDHWETVIFPEDDWSYYIGDAAPSSNWTSSDFDYSSWATGAGGIGYGDNDDNTIISPTTSLYLRKDFEVIDLGLVEMAVLHADFDDGFVAYLNGTEIARSNLGSKGQVPSHNELAHEQREAMIYQGKLPEEFALYPPKVGQLLLPGKNTLAIQVHNHTESSSDLSSLFFLSLAIKEQVYQYRPVPTWFYEPFLSSRLPILVVNTFLNDIVDEPKIEAHLGIIANTTGGFNAVQDPLNEYDGRIGIEIRGASSQQFSKKNFGFETRLISGENNNVSLLGLPKENDWVLHGPYSDKTLIRNHLAYHMSALTGQYAPRTRLCELIIDHQYQGVYLLTEKIKRDKNRVDIANLKAEDIAGDEVSGGYIIQVDRDDPLLEDGWRTSIPPPVFYKYHDPDYDELQPEQKLYIQNFMSELEETMNTSSTTSNYSNLIDISSFIDYWIITEIGKHVDAYKLSFFMHKKKDSNGGKLHMGPIWDFNLAFGNFDFVLDPGPEGWAFQWGELGEYHPFWIRKLLSISSVQNRINCWWFELRQSKLQTDSLMQFIDDQLSFLMDAQERNYRRWQVLGDYIWPNNFVGEDYQEETMYLRNWLIARLSWMDANMVGTCAPTSNGANEKVDLVLQVKPNSYQDELTFVFNSGSVKEGKLQIFDGYGQIIRTARLVNGTAQKVSIRSQPDGFYFYKIIFDNEFVKCGKLIKS